MAVFAACGSPADNVDDAFMLTPTPGSDYEAVRRLLYADSVTAHTPASLDMPDECVRLEVHHVGRYREVFNDSNYVHWSEAAIVGIEPITDTRGHWQMRRPLEKIASCEDFYVEPMRYSAPYLVPKAACLLHDIGRRFRDTLKARGGGDYRVKVTSVLRTPSTVKRLRRVNRNSIDSSAHLLGTTFDISYARFVCDNPRGMCHTADDLKGILAEVLWTMREEGRCYVKFEAKQPCFHISCRDYSTQPNTRP